MDDAFPIFDDLGPARVIHVCEPTLGLAATLVIDNLACGPAIGGLRMAPDVSTAECARLARAMTLKNAAAGLPHGGGKSVLRGDPRLPAGRKEALIRAFAHALRHESDYIFGPDMGTDEGCMAWVHDEIGRAVGLPREVGGIPLDELGATGWGLCAAADVAAPTLGLRLDGARVAVQGFGAVGQHAARFLTRRGGVLVAAADSSGTVVNARGLDVDALVAFKRAGHSVADFGGGERRARDAVIDADCELWIPAARPDVLDESNADRLRAKLVLEGANIPCTPAAERRLAERGVVVVPDFIANAGGVICAAMEWAGATQAAAFDAIAERIRANTEAVLQAARRDGTLPRAAAERLASARVRRAMGWRRFSTC